MKQPNLKTKLGKLTLQNPVVVASGTFGSKDEYASLVDYNALGAIITKSITLNARVGNRAPRICETAAGMLNAIGLENKGVDHFMQETIPYYKKRKTKLIVSIAGNTIQEYKKITQKLAQEKRIDAIEINISCPNVKHGGIAFIQDENQSRRLVETVRAETDKPLFVKVSPEARDLMKLVDVCIQAGCDGISLINTIKGMAVDIETKRPKLGNICGGLSGPAIKPIALRYVYEVKKQFAIPVIAGGGIMTVDDALEFLIVGADALCVGTVNFVNPRASMDIIKGLGKYCRTQKVTDLKKIRGSIKT